MIYEATIFLTNSRLIQLPKDNSKNSRSASASSSISQLPSRRSRRQLSSTRAAATRKNCDPFSTRSTKLKAGSGSGSHSSASRHTAGTRTRTGLNSSAVRSTDRATRPTSVPPSLPSSKRSTRHRNRSRCTSHRRRRQLRHNSPSTNPSPGSPTTLLRWTGWNARNEAHRQNLDQEAIGQHRAPPILTILDIDFGVKSVSGRLLKPTARFCHGFNTV